MNFRSYRFRFLPGIFLLSFITISTSSLAQLSVSKLYGDHMVIQRGEEIRVWGWAAANEKIILSFKGETYKGKAAKDGSWMLSIPAQVAGGPFEMEIRGKEESIKITDIMLGDVWICSGQSNMEWTVENSNNFEAEIPAANDPMIRHFKVPRTYAENPEPQLAGGSWEQANPETVGKFTAVGYFFAREIRKHQDVPIGLVNTSWGGSRLEPWMSSQKLSELGYEGASFKAFKEKAEKEYQDNLKRFGKKFPHLMKKSSEAAKNWSDPGISTEDWQKIQAPGLWESQGYEALDGVIWYRREFNLTEAESKQDLELGLGKIDDSDISFVNGFEVGKMEQAYNKNRVYQVPARFLKAGKNVIAIKIEDTGGGGGIHGGEDGIFMVKGGELVSLAGEWKMNISEMRKGNFAVNQIPSVLYNKMIHPLLNFPIKGALWYQGESNAGNVRDATAYAGLFKSMIEEWRASWGLGDFPFLYVQLANFMQAKAEPSESNWALLRESQDATTKLKNAAQAVIIDIGEADDIHPRNKQDVGLRLSLAARKLAYEEELVYSGPAYKAMEKKEGAIYLSFDHVGSGLWAKDKYGYLKGFAIAGADNNFVWAKAIIEGDKVKVWSEEVPTPQHVRYGWADNPDDANLYNREGLPASPFRTDKIE